MNRITSFFQQPRVWGFFAAMAVMVIVSIAFFYPDNFQGRSLNQADMQQGAANGQEGVAYMDSTGEKALWTNSLFSGMPTFQISPSYSSNSLFRWIDSLYGLCLPAPSNLLFMMMFGFFIMMCCMRVRWYYGLIGAVAWGLSSYFVIIIGAGHIWKFVTLSYIPPTIGGLVLCYRGRYLLGGALTALFAMMQLNANHPQMTYYFGFVMAGFVIVYLIYAIKDRKIATWGIATAVVIGAGMLAVGANLPSLYNTYEYAKETKRSQSELTPVSTESNTAAERPTGGLPKADIVSYSYGRSEMMSLLIPNVKGGASAKPVAGNMQIMSLDKLDKASSYTGYTPQLLQYFTQYFNDSEGTNGPVYVGALIFALFLLGCVTVRGPMKWCLVVLTLLSVLLAMGRNFESLTDLMIYYFPMYSKFRAVESILVIAEFTIPLLAVLGLVQYLSAAKDTEKDPSAQKKTLVTLGIAFGIPALICLAGWMMPSIFGDAITSQDQQVFAQMEQQDIPVYDVQQAVIELRYGMVSADCMRSLLFLVMGFATLLCFSRGILKRKVAVPVIFVLVLCDLFTIDRRYVDSENFVDASYASTADTFSPDAIDNVILQDTASSYRVMDIPGFGDARRSFYHKMVGGYHAAKLNRYEDLIQRRMRHVLGLGYLPSLRTDSILNEYGEDERKIALEARADYRVLDMLNAKYIITGDEKAPVMQNTSALGNAWLVDEIKYVDNADQEMAALATLDPAHQAVADKKFLAALGNDVVKPQAGDTVRLTRYTPNCLTYHVDTKGGGLCVFSEVYFPWGWKADIDGKEAAIGRVNYILRAVKVPAGSHTLTMTFDPASIHTTNTVAYACVTIIYLLLLAAIAFIIKKKEDNESTGK